MNSALRVRLVILLLFAGLLHGFLLAGCNSAPKTAQAPAEDEGEEEVTYQTTGSMLPRRAKRSQAPKEYLTVENSDSPTLQMMEKKHLMSMTPKSR